MFVFQRKGKGKPVSASALNTRIEFPGGLHPHEVIFGGKILRAVDLLALKVAQLHAERNCIMQGIDFVRFFSPVRKKDLLICKSSVNRTWGTILEVGVKVVAEDFYSLEQKNVLSAYFTYLAVEWR